MQEKQSQEQKLLIREIIEREDRINQIFKDLDLRASNKSQETPSTPQQPDTREGYLAKYGKYSIKNIKQNYKNAFLPFKWYQLPFCRNVIARKIQFFIPASSILALVYTMHRMKTQNLTKFPFKYFGKSYLAFAVGTSVFAFFQSLLTQPYCDINSHHYNEKLSGLELARKLKKQFDQR